MALCAWRRAEHSKGRHMMLYKRNTRIEWGDCDPAGIVFFPRYFALFDSCTTALFSQALGGMSKHQFTRHYGFAGYPMVDTRARFFKPCKYGDDVQIETKVAEFRRSSFDVQHRLTLGGELAVECFDTRVWVKRDPNDAERIRATPIPHEVIAKFNGR
jgi:4-hydroxybenzoyl-CoA thioesterase